MKNKLISVIVTTKNEETVIERLLKSIKDQTYKFVEIIVVDNNSTDRTTYIAKKYTKKLFSIGPERSAQRNLGAKKANGDYLLFLDADMELSKDVLLECFNCFESGRNIGGVIIPEQSVAGKFWEKVKGFERSFYNLEGDQTTDAARFFPRKVFLKAGGYDETITGPEDWDLPENIRKLGFNFRRINAPIYHYERINSLYSLARKKFYYGLKSHRYMNKQKLPIIGPKTVYFLRPVFYKNWKMMLRHPVLTLGMVMMFSVELFGGGLGYIWGLLTNE